MVYSLRDLVRSFELERPRHPPDPSACDLIQVLNFLLGQGLTLVVLSPLVRDCEGLVPLFFGVHSAGWGSPSHLVSCGFPGCYTLPILPSSVCRQTFEE